MYSAAASIRGTAGRAKILEAPAWSWPFAACLDGIVNVCVLDLA
jgi:hypothetical protein